MEVSLYIKRVLLLYNVYYIISIVSYNILSLYSNKYINIGSLYIYKVYANLVKRILNKVKKRRAYDT
jgi:hypothetical protein